MPALPLEEAGKYVAAAYVVFVVLLVIYIGIMAAKLGRISAELEEILRLSDRVVVMRDHHLIDERVNRGVSVDDVLATIAAGTRADDRSSEA